MTAPRQTQTYLRHLFSRRGIIPKRRFGQNFLIDLNLHDLIARTAELEPTDVVLEVGSGTGALTALLARSASAVVSVEVDPALAKLAKETVSGYPNVRVLNIDALRRKNTIHPEVINHVQAGLAIAPDRRLKLVANLPYAVATPIISNLLVHPELQTELMVVTIQKELADRMMAAPGDEAYGALSILIQGLTDVELVRLLSPKVFWPRPKVESAILKIRPDPAKRAAVGDLPWFHEVVRRIFLLRRKNLRQAIYATWKDRWESKAQVDALLETLGLTGDVRAEMMNVEEMIALAEALKATFGGQPPASGLEPDGAPDPSASESSESGSDKPS